MRRERAESLTIFCSEIIIPVMPIKRYLCDAQVSACGSTEEHLKYLESAHSKDAPKTGREKGADIECLKRKLSLH